MRKKKFVLFGLIVFVFAFLAGGFMLLRPVTAEIACSYQATNSESFTLSDTVILKHGDYAIGVDGDMVVPFDVTAENGEISSEVSSAMLWQVKEGEEKNTVCFQSVASGEYLRWSEKYVVLGDTGVSFYNQNKLLSTDGEYVRFLKSSGRYEWNGKESLGVTVEIYRQVELQPEAFSLHFYNGEQEVCVKEVPVSVGAVSLESLGISNPTKDGYTFVGWGLDGDMVAIDEEIEVDKDLSFFACYTVGEKYRASLSLKGDIAIHAYVRFDEETANDENGYMRISACGKSENVAFSSAEQVAIEQVVYHKFTCRVSAKDYDKNVDMQVFIGEEEGTAFSYSVKEYAEKLLASTDDGLERVKPLVSALLVYCQAAKGYCYDGVTATVEGVDVSNVEKYKTVTSGTLLEGVRFLGGTLILETTTKLRVYFSAQEQPVCTVDGVATEAQKDEHGRYYLEILDIAAKDLDQAHLFTIGDFSVSASALSYVYAVLNGNYDEHLQSLVKALYLYNVAANEYFQGVN